MFDRNELYRDNVTYESIFEGGNMNDSSFNGINNWKRNFNIFLTGQFLSGVTSMIVQYSIIWYLTLQTGSATILSIASILGMLPMIVLSPFVGGIVDRSHKRSLLIATDAVAAVVAVILAIVGTISKDFPIWLVFVSLFIRAVAQTFQQPIIQSTLPSMVPSSDITRSNGLLGMIQSANFIIAPALGAFLYAFVPIQYLILLDVVGFILGAGTLLFVKMPDNSNEKQESHFIEDAKLGFKLLKSKNGLWILTIIGTIFTLFFMPAGSMYPLMTVQYFHGTVAQAGIVEVAFSVGMLLGGAFIGMKKHWVNRATAVAISMLITGVTLGGSALLPGDKTGFMIFVAINAVAGLAVPFFSTLVISMVQESYPVDNLGKVMGVMNSLMNIGGPLGLIFAGPVGDKIGVQNLFLIAGIGSLICAAMFIVNKSARTYDLQLQQTKKAEN